SLYYARQFYNVNLINSVFLATVTATAILLFVLFYLINIITSGLISFLLGGIVLTIVLGLYLLKARSEWVFTLRSLVFSK
ncbi:MAG: hypothetical protein JSW54_13875, partial [Fidelibacterota bacterium]